MSKNDGGPAFPGDLSEIHAYQGMTLRDYFAGQVLAGLVAFPHRHGENNKPEHFAKWSYALADAMIEERDA